MFGTAVECKGVHLLKGFFGGFFVQFRTVSVTYTSLQVLHLMFWVDYIPNYVK